MQLSKHGTGEQMAHSTWIINNSIEIKLAVINGNKMYRGCSGIEEMVCQ